MKKNPWSRHQSAACILSLIDAVNLYAADEENTKLEKTVITSTGFETPLKDEVKNVYIITSEEIKDRGYRDLSDILSQVPGLYMAPAAKDSKMVRVRGASSDQTKIYIDGIPTFPLTGIVSNAASDLSTIPADSIAKVEIIKGSGPVQYGTDYKGGVILITTKDGKGAGKFRVSAAGGSNHTYDAKLGYSGSDKNVSYAVNLSKHYSAGYLENQMDKKIYFDGKIKFKTSSKSSLMLNGYYSDMEREVLQSVDPATGKYVPPSGPRWSVATGDGITSAQKK